MLHVYSFHEQLILFDANLFDYPFIHLPFIHLFIYSSSRSVLCL